MIVYPPQRWDEKADPRRDSVCFPRRTQRCKGGSALKKHSSKRQTARARIDARQTGITAGLDIGDAYIHVAVLNQSGELIWEGRIRTREVELRRWLAELPP